MREVQAHDPDATHHCWAYVAGPPGSTSHIGLSDDGEPHGTAGRPMLNVLLHADVGDIVAVVTRWYGGVKLGTGGLSRAYAGAVQTALATLPRELRVDRVRAAFVVEYAAITPVRQLLDTLDVEILHEAWADVVKASLIARADARCRWYPSCLTAARDESRSLTP
ncbi:MAG: YigZ family protein [Gemmatimonadaceae bacterium]|nr:YigZ family protein [Gemmatimonadaceae bacterium]